MDTKAITLSDEQEQPPVRIPRLRATTGSIQRHLSAASRALLAGQLTTGEHKQLVDAAAKMLSSIKVEEGLQELTNLREMLRKAEEAADRRSQNEAADRYEKSGTTLGIKKKPR